MPSSTFFRLPEEKRARLIEAGWAEMTRVRFTELSISRIIAEARIPRGSFYQYFDGKEDLIRYLLGDMQGYFITLLRDILVQAEGDLFALPLMAYDSFISGKGYADPILTRFIQLITLNKGYDLQSIVGGPSDLLPDKLWEVVDPSKLRRRDRGYAGNIFRLSCAVLALAIMETLRAHGQMDQTRASIETRMDLLLYGGAAEGYGYKEETI